MLDFTGLLLLLLSLVLTIDIVVPLTGVLIRYRANYNPKGLQLDAEGGAQPYTGPIIRSYFTMLGRVYRIEGLQGFYKGTMPTTLSVMAMTIFILLVLDPVKPRLTGYKAPDVGVWGTLVYSIFTMLLSLPTVILTYRAITTPYKLSYWNAMQAFRVLLTPTERRRPWILYLTPGLLAAQVLHISIVVLFLGPLRRHFDLSFKEPATFLSAAAYAVIVALSTIILTPLEVIVTRLAIQRNHASAEYNSVSQEVEGDGENVPEYGGEEDVMGLRSEGDPYLGLVDCAKRMVDEEGWSSLYRAWWLTILAGILSTV
jgi:hypothetical protein